MIYGGQISFSLYMIHEPVHTIWDWAVAQYGIELSKPVAKIVVVGLILTAIAAAMALFRFVEEPARRWMRQMVDVRDVHDLPAGRSRLQSVGHDADARPQPASARAG